MLKLLSSRADVRTICASSLYDNMTFYKAFIKDLQYATRCVYIESPFITKKRIDDTLWEGSLNILSQNDSCEIMRRSVSSELVKQMADFVGASRYV